MKEEIDDVLDCLRIILDEVNVKEFRFIAKGCEINRKPVEICFNGKGLFWRIGGEIKEISEKNQEIVHKIVIESFMKLKK